MKNYSSECSFEIKCISIQYFNYNMCVDFMLEFNSYWNFYYLYFLFIFVSYLGGMVAPCRYTQSSIKEINIEGCKIPMA